MEYRDEKDSLCNHVYNSRFKILGFVREIALSYIYGVSTITDAYLISLTIPGVVFSFIGAGLERFHSYVQPHQRRAGVVAANRFTNNIINGTCYFQVLLCLWV